MTVTLAVSAWLLPSTGRFYSFSFNSISLTKLQMRRLYLAVTFAIAMESMAQAHKPGSKGGIRNDGSI